MINQMKGGWDEKDEEFYGGRVVDTLPACFRPPQSSS